MKIRTSFVSNSSTSSFILIITKNEHDKIVEKLKSWQQEVINTLYKKGNYKKTTLFGKEMLFLHTIGDSFSCIPNFSGLESKTKRKKNLDFIHFKKDCKFKNKEIKTEYCSGCGAPRFYQYQYETPVEAWGVYVSKVQKLNDEGNDNIFITEVRN